MARIPPPDIMAIVEKLFEPYVYLVDGPNQEDVARLILAERERCAACCHIALDPEHFIMGGPSFVARQIKALIEEGTLP